MAVWAPRSGGQTSGEREDIMRTADLEMAALDEAGDTITRYERRFGCACHSVQNASSVDPVQVCDQCGRQFATFEEWTAFRGAVQEGTWDYARELGRQSTECPHGIPMPALGCTWCH